MPNIARPVNAKPNAGDSTKLAAGDNAKPNAGDNTHPAIGDII